jgi:hypothetical protein
MEDGGDGLWDADRSKAVLYREANCPRRPWTVSVGGFGAAGKEQAERLLGVLLPILMEDFPVQGGFKLDAEARSELRFFCVCANPLGARRLAERVQGFGLGDTEDPWTTRIEDAFTTKEWTATKSAFEGQTFTTVVKKKVQRAFGDKSSVEFDPGGKKEFARYGLGIYLYFMTLGHLLRAFAVMSVIAFPVVFFNVYDNRAPKAACSTYTAACFAYTTVGNIPTNSTMDDGKPFSTILGRELKHLIFSVVDVVYTLYFLLTLWRLHRKQDVEIQRADDEGTTASDYTVQVSGLPENIRDPQLVGKYFEARFGPVVEVTVALRSSNLLRLYTKLGKFNRKLEVAQAKAKGELTKKVTALMEGVGQITDEIEELKTAPSEAQDIVCAFVTFDRWDDCVKAQQLYAGLLTGWFCIDHRFRWKHNEGQEEETVDNPKAGLCGTGKWGARLRVGRAPDPSNIIWENFGVSPFSVIVRRTLTALVSLLFIAWTLVAFVFGTKFQADADSPCHTAVCDYSLRERVNLQSLGSDYALSCSTADTAIAYRPGVKGKSDALATCVDSRDYCSALAYEVTLDIEMEICSNDPHSMGNMLWFYLPWFAVAFNNMVLKRALRGLGNFEKHTSQSEMASSAAIKMFVAQFVNTAVVVMAVSATSMHGSLSAWPSALPESNEDVGFSPKWYANTGGGICLALILNSIFPKLAILVVELVRSCKRRKCCTCCMSTQAQLDARFAGQELNLADRYATIWNNIFCCMLFSSGMPILLAIAAIDIWLLNRSERYFFFNVYAKPAPCDEQFAVLTVKLLPFAAMVHLLVSCWVYSMPSIFTKHELGGPIYMNSTILGGVEREPNTEGILDRLGRLNVLPVFLFFLTMVTAMAFQRLAQHSLKRIIRECKCCRNRIVPERVYRTYTEVWPCADPFVALGSWADTACRSLWARSDSAGWNPTRYESILLSRTRLELAKLPRRTPLFDRQVRIYTSVQPEAVASACGCCSHINRVTDVELADVLAKYDEDLFRRLEALSAVDEGP